MGKKYLLDTNICVHLLRGKYHVDASMDKVGFENCYISEITVAELKYGSELGRQKGYHKRDKGMKKWIIVAMLLFLGAIASVILSIIYWNK